jgi:hypothetical protein
MGDEMVFSDAIRKDDRVQLQNGWFATVLDNKVNAQVRMCRVEGLCTEMGSVYASDIVLVRTLYDKANDIEEWDTVIHSASQIKAAKMRSNFGF